MTSRPSWLVIALVVAVTLLLAGCHRQAKQLGPVNINLSDSNGNCVQDAGAGPVAVVDVPYNQSVTWCALDKAGNKLAFDLQFPAGGSPFKQSDFNAAAGYCASSGIPVTALTKTYPYQAITINGKGCGVGTDGLRIKGGP
jgi:hypothetical protein